MTHLASGESLPVAYQTEDTIAAKATPAGGAPRGILRISGPQTVACLTRCFQAASVQLLDVRRSQVIEGTLILPAPVGPLPCELYLWPGMHSYTRQPSAELHLPGSPPLLELSLETLCANGARLAQPGEFTMRAFLAGRLDLTQAEAVLGVIDAESRKELDIALRQLAGGLSGPLGRLREQLVDTLAQVEAGLDFVEEDIEFIGPEQLTAQLATATATIAELLDQLQSRGTTAEQYRVVFRGWPNVGKSSLLNALAGRRVAVVSPQHGTTRDYVTHPIVIDGLPCLLIDTAGFQLDRDDTIVLAAQQLAEQQVGDAHIELFCLDATRGLNDWERAELSADVRPQRLVVVTKSDMNASLSLELPDAPVVVRTSGMTREGVIELKRAIAQRLRDRGDRAGHAVTATAVRCRQSLLAALDGLERARQVVAAGGGDELVAAEMHVALDELGSVVGAVYTDDILDRIFSRFCIGK